MTELIVDLLEVIDIDHKERVDLIETFVLKVVIYLVHDRLVIEDTRHQILFGSLDEVVFLFSLLTDVDYGEKNAHVVVGRIDQEEILVIYPLGREFVCVYVKFA